MSAISPLERLRCPACKSGPLSEFGEGLTCAACGAMHDAGGGIAVLVKDPERHAEQLAQARATNPLWYLDQQPPEQSSPWRHHLRKRRLYVEGVLRRELAARGWEKAPALLDLGCGDGNNLAWLAAFSETLYGCDYNSARLGRAKALAPDARIFLADILDFPAPDGAFDVIFFNHVIEHIPDDISALREVRRILSPNGLLVLGAPNEGAWWWRLAYARAPHVRESTDHVHFYTGATLKNKMRDAGFDVKRLHHMGWGPPDFELDGRIRKYKWVDDIFEWVGRVVIPTQGSSLYLIANPAS